MLRYLVNIGYVDADTDPARSGLEWMVQLKMKPYLCLSHIQSYQYASGVINGYCDKAYGRGEDAGVREQSR